MALALLLRAAARRGAGAAAPAARASASPARRAAASSAAGPQPDTGSRADGAAERPDPRGSGGRGEFDAFEQTTAYVRAGNPRPEPPHTNDPYERGALTGARSVLPDAMVELVGARAARRGRAGRGRAGGARMGAGARCPSNAPPRAPPRAAPDSLDAAGPDEVAAAAARLALESPHLPTTIGNLMVARALRRAERGSGRNPSDFQQEAN